MLSSFGAVTLTGGALICDSGMTINGGNAGGFNVIVSTLGLGTYVASGGCSLMCILGVIATVEGVDKFMNCMHEVLKFFDNGIR